MPIVDLGTNLFASLNLNFFVKAFFILFLVFYTVYSVMLFRQVQIMTTKLPTQLSPLLKFFGLLNVGISLALLFLVVGMF
jgi:hypothetical protein